MKLVILDGYAANPGDISWDSLKKFGDLTVYDRTPPDLIEERAKDADCIFLNKERINAEVLDKMPAVKYIGLQSTGFDIVDIKECDKRNIVVTNIPGYSTGNVAQTVFAYILSVCSHVTEYNTDVHNGKWVNSPDFCFYGHPMSDVAGKTLGIIGYGQIGRKVAQIARAFDMNVLIYSRTKKDDILPSEWVSSPFELAEKSDFVTFHCPLTESNLGIVNSEFISHMKKTSYIINTARGKLVDEIALADALNNGSIAGACMDVLSTEPPRSDNPLLSAKNCIITPHVAWATRDARIRLVNILTANLEAYLEGKTVNNVGKAK